MSEILRLHAFLKGSVQGVGFRFYTERLAQKFSLVGFVKNLPDRNVEIVAEGEKDILEKFLKQIETGYLGGYITGIDKSWEHPTGEFEDFGIRF